MKNHIGSKDLLLCLTKTVLGKKIFKDIYGINTYFNDRLIKTSTGHYINKETKERLIKVFMRNMHFFDVNMILMILQQALSMLTKLYQYWKTTIYSIRIYND